MQYLLMLYSNENGWNAMTPEQQAQGMQAYMAYTAALRAAGALVAVGRLQPASAATTLRQTDGRTQVLDGPYADSKEQVGGFYLIEAPNLDAALSWAARCPTVTHGSVEVRPLFA